MSRIISDYQIRVPESAEPGACLEIVKCLKISSAPETPRGAKTQYWCYHNGVWVIYGESEAPPTTQSITLQGVDDIASANGVINEMHGAGCPMVIQAVVSCDDSFEEVRTFPGVSLSTFTPDNGYGFGVPGVDTGAPSPFTVSYEGTWFGKSVSSRILTRGVTTENAAPAIAGYILNDLFYCDNPTCGVTGCGSATPSDGCRTAYGLYDNGSEILLATYHISTDNSVELISTQTLPAVNGIVSGVCLDGRIIVTDGTCVYTACGTDGLTKVVLPDDITPGSIKQLAAAAGHVYILFGHSGVAHSKNGRNWSIVLDDNFFVIPEQHGIEAVGDVVVTYGEERSLQVNGNGGGGAWYSREVTSALASENVVGVAVDLPNPFNKRYAYIYALTSKETSLTVHFSGNMGRTFEGRRTLNATVQNPESVGIYASVLASRIYLSYDSVAWVNFNYGCECDWINISPEFDCASTKTAVCSYDPNSVLMISDGECLGFARNDVAQTISDTPAVPVIIDLLSNDRAASGETLDPVTNFQLSGVLDANTQSAVFNPATGEVTVTANDGYEGVLTFQYQVSDTGGNVLIATVKVIVGDPDATALVC